MSRMSRGLNVFLWILQALLAVGFLIAGGLKLAGNPEMVSNFNLIGWGQWFRYLTGLIEVGCAIMILIPRPAPIAAVLLICTMIGAIVAHLTVLGTGGIAAPPILAAMCAVVFWGRRRRPASTAPA